MKKCCKRCGETDQEKFTSYRQSMCVTCRREYDRTYYRRRKKRGYRKEYKSNAPDKSSMEFPERELLCAIIDQAVREWRAVKNPEKLMDLHKFFVGAWYFDLCTLLDLEPNAILEEIGIGFRHKIARKPPISERQVYV